MKLRKEIEGGIVGQWKCWWLAGVDNSVLDKYDLNDGVNRRSSNTATTNIVRIHLYRHNYPNIFRSILGSGDVGVDNFYFFG